MSSVGHTGAVFGEGAFEVAPPAVPCISHCKAHNQVRDRFPYSAFPPQSRQGPNCAALSCLSTEPLDVRSGSHRQDGPFPFQLELKNGSKD
jgi:hypothetical protein